MTAFIAAHAIAFRLLWWLLGALIVVAIGAAVLRLINTPEPRHAQPRRQPRKALTGRALETVRASAWAARVRHHRPGALQAASAQVDLIVAAAMVRELTGPHAVLHRVDLWDGPGPVMPLPSPAVLAPMCADCADGYCGRAACTVDDACHCPCSSWAFEDPQDVLTDEDQADAWVADDDDRCLSCGAEIGHYNGCIEDPDAMCLCHLCMGDQAVTAEADCPYHGPAGPAPFDWDAPGVSCPQCLPAEAGWAGLPPDTWLVVAQTGTGTGYEHAESCSRCGLPGTALCLDWQACTVRAAENPHLAGGQYAEATGSFSAVDLAEYERSMAGA